ncbi:L-ribulose-5-phosphate 3-epimerase [Clostridium saccharobutylicum]|uniref:L-ribulose-5-phosphate 3-epimerase n=1 Tax=Clostridium saccharobutylicum DSM 13864 TaxID=1345695 RepID=U5MW77_CLOSA|nr:L-ribulose-5-phosphate 3-epimerase [Clostridium saccharobutylicum]AGX44798.1 L-ribulose-5-phosphate 3-epimerase UlaE [Clostridium saccharobutylicum DSM 13864]AQR92084.1 L-ribulose-5-phosphate 3-epimerase UlaE [Clostridium saccharobutylicum]AQS01986.1 L-ribulose-5-phosphate 3-epimerase UlaE [Clostridium saccharobutylicum]AQS11590.1 L-ribulose-5-phosphate 3-epimerase UlaE [Clostridium saccharobutylicum]AQS15969.1 L-ribulose-5-phosphate 3-epimerase UlaE [Clostridium saccharobutylicum]
MKEYTLGLYEKSMPNNLTWEEKLNCARECGFDTVEISIDETDEKLSRLDMSKEERKSLIELMFKCGVEIRTMCLSGHRKYPLGSLNEETRNKGMEIMKKAIELSDDLGIKIIQLAGYDVYYEEGNEQTRKYFEQNLIKSVEMAASKGVILAFETMETEFMNTVEKAMEFVKLVDSPYLQIYPDCGNVTNATLNYGTNPLEDFSKGKGHISAVHLKETVPGKFREITFGTGHVNFEEIIKKSWELGVRKFTAEFWYTGNDDWKDVIIDTKNFMDEKFKVALG